MIKQDIINNTPSIYRYFSLSFPDEPRRSSKQSSGGTIVHAYVDFRVKMICLYINIDSQVFAPSRLLINRTGPVYVSVKTKIESK